LRAKEQLTTRLFLMGKSQVERGSLVAPDAGILRHFQAFSSLRVFSTPKHCPRLIIEPPGVFKQVLDFMHYNSDKKGTHAKIKSSRCTL
jgi:hypothetical protein